MSFDAAHCTLCPRRCGADREKGVGLCHCDTEIRIARAALHPWEEPCISGRHGSGTVFFSGCALGCVFCQNRKISRQAVGKAVTVTQLAEIFLKLQEQQAHNINLVTGSHYTPWIVQALELAKPKLHIPVVWNCGGYEKPETLRRLEGKVQVYLPDLKYGLSEPARKYSGAADYFDWAKRAILEMFRQTGPYRMENGLLKQGVLIRHLLLPGELENTRRVIDWVAESFRPGEVLFSLMSQYTPVCKERLPEELRRHVRTEEYDALVDFAVGLGIENGFLQEGEAAGESFIPPFDLTGVLKSSQVFG